MSSAIFGIENIVIKDDFIEPYLTREHLYYMLRNLGGDIREYISFKNIDVFIEKYLEIYRDFKCKEYEYPFLKPIKDVGRYLFKEYTDNITDLSNLLNDYIIAGYDSSHHNPRGHFIIDFILINLGYYYQKIGSSEGGSGYHPFIVLIGPKDIDADITVKDIENKFVSKYIIHLKERFGSKKIYMLLDESLNYSYTYAWSGKKRNKYMKHCKDFINLLLNENIIPVATFYTRARDILSGIACNEGEKLDKYPPIQDKHIFNKYLDRGMRSQVFIVESKILNKFNIDIATFYIKIGEGNVIRIEFPYKLIEKYGFEIVDDIHRLVYYDSIRNMGYSYVLARSHEAAVLRYIDREDIEYIFSEIFKIPLKYVYSAKESFKRRPIA